MATSMIQYLLPTDYPLFCKLPENIRMIFNRKYLYNLSEGKPEAFEREIALIYSALLLEYTPHFAAHVINLFIDPSVSYYTVFELNNLTNKFKNHDYL